MRSEEAELIARIARRTLVYTTKMIYDANHRSDQQPGDPKVGGHPAACASSLHLLSALHLGIRAPDDMLAIKPHAAPLDHALSYQLGLLHECRGRRWLSAAEAVVAMEGLRKFSSRGEAVFQSYHSEADPDGDPFFPSGSVGIPPVAAMYTALAYRYARDHGLVAPEKAHFWAVIGDSEFREGSLAEAMPEAAERELGNLTWIVDYNRQSLDGTRIVNARGLGGSDADRIERVARANGWDVVQLRHGWKRLSLFEKPGGDLLRRVLEEEVSDFLFQSLLQKRSGEAVRTYLCREEPKLEALLAPVSDAELFEAFSDLGGHDVEVLLEAYRASKKDVRRPTLIVAHTIKGWGLRMMAAAGNHSALPEEAEVDQLLSQEGLTKSAPFAPFALESPEGRFLAERGRLLKKGIEETWHRRDQGLAASMARIAEAGLPETLGLDLRLLPNVHTQYVFGQLAAKLIRIGHQEEQARREGKKADRPRDEQRWGPAAELVVTMAPDVGTSTNINPAMDDRIYGPTTEPNWEVDLGVRDNKRPALSPHEEQRTRHIRFEIAEANCMSAVGAFGKLRDRLGVPLLPIMTVYDFFIKRALDQLYYNLYWGSSFVVIGTPSGATLAPEGAQHSWKSDIQMPNLISWEPFFAVELDWILADTVRRHYLGDDANRSGVVIRAVTRAVQQAELLKRLKGARRFSGQSDESILAATRRDVLAGGYYLVDWRGYEGYEPGENVVHIFSMGSVTTEALAASDRLRGEGIYANVIVVTSGDLLCGNLAHADGYRHLSDGLGITGELHLVRAGGSTAMISDRADYVMAAGRRVPLVAVVDGEPGLLDNLGSVVGVRSETLGLRKPSRCGRPSDVYRYLHLDADAVYEACGQVLEATALEDVRVSSSLLLELARGGEGTEAPRKNVNGHQLWPPRQ